MKTITLIKKAAALLLAAAVIPFGALAVTENEVEEAPPVNVYEEAPTEEEYADAYFTETYLPEEEFYIGWADMKPEWEDSETYVEPEYDADGVLISEGMQQPRLTAGEAKRAAKLKEAYDRGEITCTGASVLNKTTDVTVGVYELDPADFDGETVYFLLPAACLTDDEILALIDASREAGIDFDPAGLSCRNCARGGFMNASRFLTGEETLRDDSLRELIRREKVRYDQIDPDAKHFRVIRFAEGSSAAENFILRPYRRMTDDELAYVLFTDGTASVRSRIDFEELERRSRDIAVGVLRVPLSMEVEYQNESCVPYVCWNSGEHSIAYTDKTADVLYSSFRYSEGDRHVNLTVYTEQDAHSFVELDLEYTDIFGDMLGGPGVKTLSDDEIMAAGRQWMAEHFRQKLPEDLEWYFADGEDRDEYAVSVILETELDGVIYHLEVSLFKPQVITFAILYNTNEPYPQGMPGGAG